MRFLTSFGFISMCNVHKCCFIHTCSVVIILGRKSPIGNIHGV